jgi:hypothetical protein
MLHRISDFVREKTVNFIPMELSKPYVILVPREMMAAYSLTCLLRSRLVIRAHVSSERSERSEQQQGNIIAKRYSYATKKKFLTARCCLYTCGNHVRKLRLNFSSENFGVVVH